MATTERPDTAGVVAPPPLLALGAVVVGFLLDWLAPAYIITLLVPPTIHVVLGLMLIAAGAACAVTGQAAFQRGGTNVNPYQPVLKLVTDDIFNYVRNPMYVGLMLISAGLGIIFAADWVLVMTVALAFALHFGVVQREERLLEAKFGDTYRQYKSRVPRYGWPGQGVNS
jgi:protein-S-isoprenylcysteine O-methyltransferase Ste14